MTEPGTLSFSPNPYFPQFASNERQTLEEGGVVTLFTDSFQGIPSVGANLTLDASQGRAELTLTVVSVRETKGGTEVTYQKVS